MGEWFSRFSEGINSAFGPVLRAIFHPTNAVFNTIPEAAVPIVAKAAAVMKEYRHKQHCCYDNY